MRQKLHIMASISADSNINSNEELFLKLLDEKIKKAVNEVLIELGDKNTEEELHYVDYEWGEPC